MIVISESFWMKYNLQQHYDLADKIIIVEGAVPEFVELGLANSDGSSIDDTADIIENFPDPKNKIKFIRAGLKENRNQLRQVTLDNVETDWCIIIDADEFYHTKDFKKIKEAINIVDDTYCGLKYSFLSFKDFNSYVVDSPMERAFKYCPNLYYKNINSGQSLFKDFSPYWEKGKLYSIPIFCYHYHRIGSTEQNKVVKKVKYYLNRDHNINLSIEEARVLSDVESNKRITMKAVTEDHPALIQKKFKTQNIGFINDEQMARH